MWYFNSNHEFQRVLIKVGKLCSNIKLLSSIPLRSIFNIPELYNTEFATKSMSMVVQENKWNTGLSHIGILQRRPDRGLPHLVEPKSLYNRPTHTSWMNPSGGVNRQLCKSLSWEIWTHNYCLRVSTSQLDPILVVLGVRIQYLVLSTYILACTKYIVFKSPGV